MNGGTVEFSGKIAISFNFTAEHAANAKASENSARIETVYWTSRKEVLYTGRNRGNILKHTAHTTSLELRHLDISSHRADIL